MSQQEMQSIPAERNPSKEKQSQTIKQQIEAYLASGGEIDRKGFQSFSQIKRGFNGSKSKKQQSVDEFKRWVDHSM